jgi:hypothetical protein
MVRSYHDYPLTIPKIKAIIFPADGTLLNFFGRGEPGCFHCMLSSLEHTIYIYIYNVTIKLSAKDAKTYIVSIHWLFSDYMEVVRSFVDGFLHHL